MFTLSVRSLDGSRRDVELGPETTIADIRAQLERQLPAFHTVQLFHGTHELLDGSAVEVELQAVTVQSPQKALAKLERLASGKGAARKLAALELMYATAKAFGEMQNGFTPAVCEQLLLCLQRQDGLQMEVMDTLAATFGRMCGNPSPYVTELVEMLSGDRHRRRLAAIAGMEIVLRSEPAALPNELSKALIDWAETAVDDAGDSILDYYILPKACEVLGALGGDHHVTRLQRLLNDAECPEAAAAAAAALKLISDRRTDQDLSVLDNATMPVNSDTAVVAESGADAETDLQMKEALSKSEQEALLREQEDLQESILRSKADCQILAGTGSVDHAADSADSENRLVLLCFQSRRKEFFDALRASPLAARFEAAGGVLQPEWARGRLILAENVTEAVISEARDEWHAAVRVADEGEVHAVLRSMLGRERPRLKAKGGRVLVPQGTSLFQLSECSVAEETHTFDEPGLFSDWGDLDVQRTFIHIPSQTIVSPRTSVSAPAALSTY